jgi:hypothetical protein
MITKDIHTFSGSKNQVPGSWWLILVILATLEAEIRRITVGGQPGQIGETPSRKYPTQKRAGGLKW